MSIMNKDNLKRDLRVDLRVQFSNSFSPEDQSSSVTGNSNARIVRPKRAAAEFGEQTRRYIALKNRDLDSQLAFNMGTSSDTRTKDGKRRLEFHGK